MYAPLSFDAPDAASLGSTYMISSIPTLLSFDAGEAQTQTKVADVRKMADRQFLVEWICIWRLIRQLEIITLIVLPTAYTTSDSLKKTRLS